MYTLSTLSTHYLQLTSPHTQCLARVPQFPVCHNLAIRLVTVTLLSRVTSPVTQEVAVFNIHCHLHGAGPGLSLTYNSSREILLNKICVMRTMKL